MRSVLSTSWAAMPWIGLLLLCCITVTVIGEGHGSSNYQYAAVPHYGAWEFGYKRGNPYHFQERHEVGRGDHFKTKVRWGDKYGGHGEQHYDYNHHDKGYGRHH